MQLFFFIPRNDSTLSSGYGPFCVHGTLLDIWEKDINECFEVFLSVTVRQYGTIFNFLSWKVLKRIISISKRSSNSEF